MCLSGLFQIKRKFDMKKIIIPIIILLGFISAFANEFEEQLKKAGNGNTTAQYELGHLYLKGDPNHGIQENPQKGIFWLRKAGMQGFLKAQISLRHAYRVMEKIADPKEAVFWSKKASEQGDVNSQGSLGGDYYFGLYNIPQNYKLAYYWYKKAALNGDDLSQYMLGKMYSHGEGVPQNYKLAYIWFSISAAQGHKDAVKKRNLFERKLTPQQLGEAQDLAVIKQKYLSELNTKSILELKPIPDQKSVNGRFITNSIAGTLFIVTGEVENITSDLISYIEIKGTLIVKGSIKAMHQTVFCGNIITENALKTSNVHEMINQLMIKNGQDNKNINIKPGGKIPFMIVFSDLPAELENFTVKVSGFDKLN